ncbi:RNB domain-containing ribonuclease [Citricoccus sp. SGAir0253]|uniref:RNB domain-containing ribonuclease n=1 Tax=Citricoccus sp. SGAir0253 TaxID=2567881 RepID=UPI0010CD5612|nr:RNB domain-containing ribonuclease [Citricoccus sp. SGAir0253]QCU77708.1 RNB domain-containing ribonuclease [Citricoccus sp. SGAir0253]
MSYYHLDLARSAAQTELARRMAALRDEFGLPAGFSPEVLAEAERAAAAVAARLPERDRTGLPLVTIDPPGSTDLDQALFIEPGAEGHPEGFTVHYAVADVPAFIVPGGALDAETLRRGQTVYLPDGRVPLHPEVISEGQGSLLPRVDRGAYLWTFSLDAAGTLVGTDLERATVRSREQLTYEQAQARIDAGPVGGPPGPGPDGGAGAAGATEAERIARSLALLRRVGILRTQREAARGGASLRLPEQEITATDGGYAVLTAPPLQVEDWNAQVSLLTGMAAARIMLDGGVGILRTMPAADDDSVDRFRARTRALGRPWPREQSYGEYLRGLDIRDPQQLAIMHAATSLFRGAGYTAFDGEVPAQAEQSAIAAPYAHATAPLRRLVDRFVLVTCLALVRGEEVPAAVRGVLPALPEAMRESTLLASRTANAALELVEAASLHGLEGREFDAVVVSAPGPEQEARAREQGRLPWGEVQVEHPPVLARYEGFASAGSRVRVVLVTADMATRTVLFRVAGQEPPAEPARQAASEPVD